MKGGGESSQPAAQDGNVAGRHQEVYSRRLGALRSHFDVCVHKSFDSVEDIRILPMRVQDTNARTNPHNDESGMRKRCEGRVDQTSWDSSPFLPFFVALGRSSGWMNGTTPPWEMTTSPRSLFSLSERYVRRSHD
jgi:hypothetical protein